MNVTYCHECGRLAARTWNYLCANCCQEAEPLGEPHAAPICDRCGDRVPKVSLALIGEGPDAWKICGDCREALLPGEQEDE